MEWNESADETSRANNNTRTETVPNILIPRDYLEFYGSTPGKTTTARGRDECHSDTLKPPLREPAIDIPSMPNVLHNDVQCLSIHLIHDSVIPTRTRYKRSAPCSFAD